MGELAKKLTTLGSSIRDLTRSPGVVQIVALSKLDVQKAEAAIVIAGRKLIPTIRQMLLQSYSLAGIHTHTGTMLDAIAQSVVNVQTKSIICSLKAGAAYPDGKGDVYAAAASLKYGSVRSPGTGAKTKVAIKNAVLYGIKTSSKKANSLIGRTAVVAPRPNFYALNDYQIQIIQQLWVKGISAEFKSMKLVA